MRGLTERRAEGANKVRRQNVRDRGQGSIVQRSVSPPLLSTGVNNFVKVGSQGREVHHRDRVPTVDQTRGRRTTSGEGSQLRDRLALRSSAVHQPGCEHGQHRFDAAAKPSSVDLLPRPTLRRAGKIRLNPVDYSGEVVDDCGPRMHVVTFFWVYRNVGVDPKLEEYSVHDQRLGGRGSKVTCTRGEQQRARFTRRGKKCVSGAVLRTGIARVAGEKVRVTSGDVGGEVLGHPVRGWGDSHRNCESRLAGKPGAEEPTVTSANHSECVCLGNPRFDKMINAAKDIGCVEPTYLADDATHEVVATTLTTSWIG